MAKNDSSSLPNNTIIGGYRLHGLIGRGGMGAVYRAEQMTLQREVAVKVLHPSRVQDKQAVENFVREARIAASLSHHHLVPVYDVGFDEEQQLHFYAMKLIEGRTLSTVVQQEGVLSITRATSIMTQVAGALGHAHNQNIVHRDLKPGNIILCANEQAVVTDLGLAMDRFTGHKVASKRILKLVGTAEYAAPEQLRNPDRATAASDVWAIGATLYFLLTAEDPFTGDTLLDLVVAVATEEPAKLRGLPDPVQRVLRALMAKHADERPDTGHAAQSLLETLNSSARPAAPGSVSRRRPAVARVSRRRRR